MRQALIAVAPDGDLKRVMRSMTRHRVRHITFVASATWWHYARFRLAFSDVPL
jgi:hypothetical protein